MTMSEGSLKLPLTDVSNESVTGTVSIDFEPMSGSAGGQAMRTGDIDLGGATEITVRHIQCLAGPGTMYKVGVNSTNYKLYSFFQRIMEKQVNKSTDNQIRLVVNPGKVKDINAPSFDGLPAKLQAFLNGAAPIVRDPEDQDLAGLRGAALYDAAGPLRKASLLNLFTKARHASSAGVFRFLENQTLRILRQDRFFSTIDPAVEKFLTNNPKFKSASNLLHDPLPGFTRGNSFKSRDAHANIQVTLMEGAAGTVAADIDIDESSGIEHGFEVIRNVFKGRTNPYLVRELLILSGLSEKTLDPGYRFIFK